MGDREELIKQIDRTRASLYATLRAEPPAQLARRPASGEWSVVENVRHLLYAEQRHLGRVLLADFAYSGMGLRPDGRRASPAGPEPSDDIEVVLKAWDAVHRPIRAAARRADDVERALDRNFAHLRAHVRIIGRLLDEPHAARGDAGARAPTDKTSRSTASSRAVGTTPRGTRRPRTSA